MKSYDGKKFKAHITNEQLKRIKLEIKDENNVVDSKNYSHDPEVEVLDGFSTKEQQGLDIIRNLPIGFEPPIIDHQ